MLPTDRKILPNGIEDVRSDARRFNVLEAQRRMEEINAIPTLKRPDYFAVDRMREVAAAARKAAKLNVKESVAKEKNVDITKLRARLETIKSTTEKLTGTYESLAQERSEQGTSVRTVSGLRTDKAGNVKESK